jgi:HTH-type transcriptional regulator/antitoxin HigA
MKTLKNESQNNSELKSSKEVPKSKKIKPNNSSITSKSDYNVVMNRINALMNKGSENVTKEELSEIRRLALLAQDFEKKEYRIPLPTTLAGMIEMKMYELRLNQNEMAKKLHISNTKLSLIMNGKQKPDISFLKRMHTDLNIDGNFLIEAA